MELDVVAQGELVGRRVDRLPGLGEQRLEFSGPLVVGDQRVENRARGE